MRVVSLLPSTTEILFAIGAGDEVVGVSSDCDWPAAVKSLPAVSYSTLATSRDVSTIDEAVRAHLAEGGNLYRLREEVLRELRPDVIVTQDLCAVCAVDVATVDDAVSYLGCASRVITIDPGSLVEVLGSILLLGRETGHLEEAQVLHASLLARLAEVKASVRARTRPRVLVLEWTDPPFGAGHWVPDMVTAAGATPMLAQPGGRSVQLSWDDVSDIDADVVIAAPCGFHLPDAVAIAEALLAETRLPSGAAVWAVDADAAFVRPGPRLVDGVEALASIVHPGACPGRLDLARYVGTTSAKTNPSRSTT